MPDLSPSQEYYWQTLFTAAYRRRRRSRLAGSLSRRAYTFTSRATGICSTHRMRAACSSRLRRGTRLTPAERLIALLALPAHRLQSSAGAPTSSFGSGAGRGGETGRPPLDSAGRDSWTAAELQPFPMHPVLWCEWRWAD